MVLMQALFIFTYFKNMEGDKNFYEVKTATNECTLCQISGFWKPLFKDRYVNGIMNLRLTDSDTIVMDNEYPYVYGDVQQLVIFSNKDNFIISDKYDYILCKSDKLPYYDLILKNPSPIETLIRMKIFIRHANREPINHWPIIDGQNLRNYNAPLLPSANNSVEQLVNAFNKIESYSQLCQSNLISSPVKRCIDTVKLFQKFWETNNKITIEEKYQFLIDPKYYSEFDKLHTMNNDVLIRLGKLLNIEITYQMQLYELWTTRICYIDMGYKNNILYDPIWQEVEPVLQTLYNCFFLFYKDKKHFPPTDGKSEFICTHDNLIFYLAKFYQNTQEELKLPKYLSNIRIEHWSNSCRIYYDNLLISWFLS